MSIYAIKPQFQKLLKPISSFCIGNGISADALNWAGVFFAGVAGALLFFAKETTLLYAIVPLLLFLRIASNALDGMVARETEVSSRWGAYLNELGDRISDLLLFGMVVLSGHGSMTAGVSALVVTVLVSFSGTLTLAAGGSRVYVGIMGKPDRMFVLGAASVLSLFSLPFVWETALWIVTGGGIVTATMRIRTSFRELSDESVR